MVTRHEPGRVPSARVVQFPTARVRRSQQGTRAPCQLSFALQDASRHDRSLSLGGSGIRVGLSSWTDKGLIASGFYPKGCTSAEERLRYYASLFPTAGVDCSFVLPSDRNARLWAERTPEAFTFNVRALRLFTGHPMFVQTLPRDVVGALGPRLAGARRNLYYRDLPDELRRELWDRFKLGLRPLRQAGKLGAVLLRFPEWVSPGPGGCAHLRECARYLRGYPLAVEFDHAGWLDSSNAKHTLELERGLGIAHVVTEGPLDGTCWLPTWDFTSPKLAVVRMDGRPPRSPEDGERDLARLLRQTSILAEWVERVQVVFDHNVQGEAARDAVRLMRLLNEQVC